MPPNTLRVYTLSTCAFVKSVWVRKPSWAELQMGFRSMPKNCGGVNRWCRHLSSLWGTFAELVRSVTRMVAVKRQRQAFFLAPFANDEFRGPQSDTT
ncbi:hypothetical protein TNCV_2564781 [Trichonephila clavipes]|nr:hypothetical protein TNCV_2564781 [Trichonephila clavipes]